MPEKESVGSFDETAIKAREEFAKLLGALCEEETNRGKKILGWQKKWYLQAGHKRLERILVEFANSYKLYKF
jgi:hypothetical protein